MSALEQEMLVHLSDEMAEVIQHEPTPVFDNVLRDNPRIDDIITYLIHPLRGAPFNARIRRRLVVMGLSGIGKTNFMMGLFGEVWKRTENDPEVKPPYIVTRDLTTTYNIGHINMNGWIQNPIGKMTNEDYFRGQVLDEEIGRVLHNHVPGNMIELQEGVGVTQNFGKNGELRGIPRINLGSIRTDVRNGAGIFVIGLTADEQARQDRLNRRMIKNQIKEGQRVVTFGNPAVGGQQLDDMLRSTHARYRDGVAKPHNPYYFRSNFVDHMHRHPELVMPLTRDEVLPGIIEGIYGSAHDRRAAIAYNEEITEDVKFEEDVDALKFMKEQNDALRLLIRLVQTHPNPAEREPLRFALERWGVPLILAA